MLNKAIVMGRLTRDPEIKKTKSGISVCSFSIACDRDIVDKSTNERGVDFINVTTWRSTADLVGKYFTKGRMIVVEGRIQVQNYTDKDGNKRTVTEIVANSVYFGDSKKSDAASNSASSSGGTETTASQEEDKTEDDPEELPF